MQYWTHPYCSKTYTIGIIVVHLCVKSHEMNEANVHTPPNKKKIVEQSIDPNSFEYNACVSLQAGFSVEMARAWIMGAW